MWHIWGRGAVHTGFWRGHLRERELGKPSCRWEDNIKMDLQEVGWMDMDWSDLAQERDKWQALLNVVLNIRVDEMRGIS
jgi:hypothetical protein